MTRIALISDSHFCERSRFRECVRVHDWIVSDIAERGVDLVLHGGDVFDARSTPLERAAVAGWLSALAEHAPVIVCRGNHDADGDLGLFAKLRTQHPVIVAEEPAVHTVGGVAVACLPWPRKSALLSSIGGNVSREQSEGAAREALRALLIGLGEQMPHDCPRVLLAHAMVRASRVSSGQPVIGGDFEIGVEDLALAGADVVALGHVHLGQNWLLNHEAFGAFDLCPVPVIYPGSPRRTAFGETEAKGYVVIDVDAGACVPMHDGDKRVRGVDWLTIATPCAPMLDITGAWSDGGMRLDDGALEGLVVPAGALPEIRFRYVVAADQRAIARTAAESIATDWAERFGDAVVQIEPRVIETSTARAPEMARALTTAEQLAVLWRTRGEEPSDERLERVLGLLGEIEEQEASGS